MNTLQKKADFRSIRLYFFVIFCLMAASLQLVTTSKFNFDEYFTLNIIRKPWLDVIRLTALDVHPPLYYLVMKLAVSLFGESLLSVHLVSLGCTSIMLIVTDRFFTRYFSDKAAKILMLTFCAAPNMLRYALMVRMYSMSMLWAVLAFYLIYLLVLNYEKGTKRYWIMLALVNVAAAYTHYFGGVAAVGLSLFLLIFLLIEKGNSRRIWIQWGVYCVSMALLYLPWMVVLFGQMHTISGDYWIPALTRDSLWEYIDILVGMSSKGMRYGLCIILFLGTFYFILGRGGTKHIWQWGAFFTAVFFFLFGVGYSVLATPILILRYFVIVAPLLWIPIIVNLTEQKEKWIDAGLVIFLCLCFIINREELVNEYKVIDNGKERQCLENNMAPDDVIYYENVQRLAEWSFFRTENEHFLLNGCDEDEVFHYWPELTDCTVVDGVSQVITTGSIWCETNEFEEEFFENGYSVEEYPAQSEIFYRYYKP